MRGVDVDLICQQEARHPKVRDLEVAVLPHQDVPAGQVTVDDAQGGEVLLCTGRIEED